MDTAFFKHFRPWTAALLSLIAAMCLGLGDSRAAEQSSQTPIRIQLKWHHQFQFAGLYAALDQGYFRDAGLEVHLLEGGPSLDPADEVLDKHAEFGIGNSSLLLDYNHGKPLVAVAAIFQHSPFVILARRTPEIKSVKDLEGHTLMGEAHSVEIETYLKLAGVDIDKITQVPHTGTAASLKATDPSGIDAATAYVGTEPYQAAENKIPYQIFNPRSIGINFYGDTLFTTRDYADQNPQTVAAVKKAVVDGWSYALAHPGEMIALIQAKYNPDLSLEFLAYESHSTASFLDLPVVEIGYMSPQRWQAIGQHFNQAGLMGTPRPIDDFLFDTRPPLLSWTLDVIVAASSIATLGMLGACYLIYKARTLRTANRRLEQASGTDFLTGLYNRLKMTQLIDDAITAHAHGNSPPGVIMIDIDHFKEVNDQHGHQVGDEVLKTFARVLLENTRSTDHVGRWGGEEFIILSPDTPQTGIQKLAEHLRTQIEATEFMTVGRKTASFGATICRHNETDQDLIARADKALYAAKNKGRNQVEFLP